LNKTKHFGLILPKQDDFYDIDVFNQNSKRIDALFREIEQQRPKTLIAAYLESGTFYPADYGLVGKTVDVYMVGGGAGAGISAGRAGGGGGGYCKLLRDLILDQERYDIIIGAGGTGGTGQANGNHGGSTLAFGAQVSGGRASGDPRGGDGGSGGGGDGRAHTSFAMGGDGGSMGSGGSGMGGVGAGNLGFDPVNPYDGIPYGCGGGGSTGGRGGGMGGASSHAQGINGHLGGGGGGGSIGMGGIPTGGASSSGGNGGIGGGGGGAGVSGQGGSGGSGLVYIYARPESKMPETSEVTPLASLAQAEYLALMDECKDTQKTIAILQEGICIDVAIFSKIETAQSFLQAGHWPKAEAVTELQDGLGIGDKWNGKSWEKCTLPDEEASPA